MVQNKVSEHTAELEDVVLTMEVEINSADEERLKNELLNWWDSNACGMGDIAFSTKKKGNIETE